LYLDRALLDPRIYADSLSAVRSLAMVARHSV